MSENNYEAKTVFTVPGDGNEEASSQQLVGESTQAPEVNITEGTSIDGYFVNEVLSSQGNESTVYRVRKDGNIYVLKLYKYAFKVSERKMEVLKNIDCPYIVSLKSYGYYQDRLYEVYDYYEKGSLADATSISTDKIKMYVSQLNKGLKALHSLAGEGMVHGDIKPSNIFISDDGESVVIGDFGISTIIDGQEGYSMGAIAGTPEYAPPSIGLVDKVRKTPAYDYGSLGLVVYYMVTGYSKFAGMSTEEIAKEWLKGISLDEILDTRIKMLLRGLLVADEDSRFGYTEVNEWYNGSFLTVEKSRRTVGSKKAAVGATLWFGIFDGESIEVSSLKELATQMMKHWNQAKNKLSDENLYEFVEKVDETGELVETIRKYVSENSADAAVFKTIYTLKAESNIVYKDINYGNAAAFMEKASQEMTDDIKELLLNGLFAFYAIKIGYPAETIKSVSDVLDLNNCPDEFKTTLLSYIFSTEKKFDGMSSLEELRARVCTMSLDDINTLANNMKFIAWLYYLGLKDEAMTMLAYRSE